jgi:small GTP-binding protein
VIGDATIKAQIWDTAGQEKYRLLMPIYYRNATAAIAVYDLSSPHSLARAEQDIFAFTDTVGRETTIALVGNKADLVDDVDTAPSAGKQVASAHGFVFAVMSAKTGEGVNEFFKSFLAKLITMKIAKRRMTVNELEHTESGQRGAAAEALIRSWRMHCK